MSAWSVCDGVDHEARLWARRWLILAVAAVAVSGVFAILIALARVPALGMLFPGEGFYRVALVLHVNLSQGVWFMAFAGVLWSLYGRRAGHGLERLALALAAIGTLGLVLSVSTGSVRPLMSNYLPVLDSSLFLTSLALFGGGVLLKALCASACLDVQRSTAASMFARSVLLKLSAVETIAVFGLLALTAYVIPEGEGVAYFETLFWGVGHLWQFALVSLLIYCWLELAPRPAARLPLGVLAGAILSSLVPVLLSLGIPLFHEPDSAASIYLYTWLMRWTSWEAPLAIGLALWLAGARTTLAPGFVLSLLLFVAGLLLGTLINGQTTLVTAHYHGTIGAITLAFMAVSFVLLERLGIEQPGSLLVRLQLGFYGYGVLLMMTGLAGAGLMGAPRKTPGDLAVSFSVETFSRICLGIGGLSATIGIVMFAWLLLRRLLPATNQAAYSL
jgi:hypothetical protein